VNTTTQGKARSELPFEIRAASALGISVVADALDYVGAPIFALPVIGDISDAVIVAVLYRLTGSRTSTAVNAIEFIPFIGDFVPTYTLTTLAWIIKELRKRNGKGSKKVSDLLPHSNENIQDDFAALQHTTMTEPDKGDDLRTRVFRRYAIAKSKAVAE
jgi:hypothetical protein